MGAQPTNLGLECESTSRQNLAFRTSASLLHPLLALMSGLALAT